MDVYFCTQIEDLSQSAQVAAAEKLKSAAKETPRPSEQAASAAAMEQESDEEEVCLHLLSKILCTVVCGRLTPFI